MTKLNGKAMPPALLTLARNVCGDNRAQDARIKRSASHSGAQPIVTVYTERGRRREQNVSLNTNYINFINIMQVRAWPSASLTFFIRLVHDDFESATDFRMSNFEYAVFSCDYKCRMIARRK